MKPASSNVFGVINLSISSEEVAKKFTPHGWIAGKISWYGWEITNDYSELVVESASEGEKEILIHGPVDPAYFSALVNKMKEIQLPFSMELYDEDKNLFTIETNP